MNRVSLFAHFERVKGNAGIAEHFLAQESDDTSATLEVLGRCNIIEAEVAQIRSELAGEVSRRADNVHTIGDRGDAA